MAIEDYYREDGTLELSSDVDEATFYYMLTRHFFGEEQAEIVTMLAMHPEMSEEEVRAACEGRKGAGSH